MGVRFERGSERVKKHNDGSERILYVTPQTCQTVLCYGYFLLSSLFDQPFVHLQHSIFLFVVAFWRSAEKFILNSRNHDEGQALESRVLDDCLPQPAEHECIINTQANPDYKLLKPH